MAFDFLRSRGWRTWTVLASFCAIAMVFVLVVLTRNSTPTYTAIEKQIDGTSMEPLIKNGSRMLLLADYYKTNTPQRGDIIAYNYGGNQHFLIKMVRAVPGDAVSMDPTRKTLMINGEYLKNSAGEMYPFTDGEMRLLGLYTKTGHLPAGGYFIFGDNVSNSIDSRKFWAVSRNDFFGKFIPKP